MDSHRQHVEKLEASLPDMFGDEADPELVNGMVEFGDEPEEFGTDQDFMEEDSFARLNKMSEPEKKEYLERRMAELWEPDEALLVSTPWKDVEYPPGAKFLDKHREQILALRKAANCKSFYSPLVKTPGVQSYIIPKEALLSTPRFLITANGYRNLGNGNIEEAIIDAETLWKMSDVSSQAKETLIERNMSQRLAVMAEHLGTAIIRSGKASKKQILDLHAKQRLAVGLHSKETWDDLDDESWKVLFINDLVADREDSALFDYLAILGIYRTCPGVVDWTTYESEYDRLNLQWRQACQQAAAGKLSYAEFEKETIAVTCGASPNHIMPDYAYYSIFGNQLWSFLKGPKTKGKMLAQMAVAFDKSRYYPQYTNRAYRLLHEIGGAIEVYKQLHDHYPEKLEQLTPELLPAIKPDPFAENDVPFTYKPNKDNFLLYSIYRNGIDDGGNDGDLVYEPPARSLLEYFLRKEL